MIEKEFNQKVEDMAARFEHRVETTADYLDKGITRKYDKSPLFRFATRGTSIAAEIGLLFSAKHLADKGYRTAAMWCIGVGIAGLAAELLRILVFRRKR